MEVFAPVLKRIESAGMQAAFYALHGNTFLTDLPACERVWEHLPALKMKYDFAILSRRHIAQFLV